MARPAAALLGVLAQSHTQHARQLAKHLWVGDSLAAFIVLDDLWLFVDQLQQKQQLTKGVAIVNTVMYDSIIVSRG